MITGRDFNKTEIIEISRYVLNNVPYSVLERVFPLTENVINKAMSFITMWRIINSAKNYVNKKETKEKLNKLLENCSEEYRKIYKLLIGYQKPGYFGKDKYYDEITKIFFNYDSNMKVNNLIDVFLIFAEKQVMYDLDKIAAIDTSSKQGDTTVTDFLKDVDLND